MTSVIARDTHPSELRPVIDAVHDSFFDVEAVRFHCLFQGRRRAASPTGCDAATARSPGFSGSAR